MPPISDKNGAYLVDVWAVLEESDYDTGSRFVDCQYDGKEWHDDEGNEVGDSAGFRVTHWMERPSPPKDGGLRMTKYRLKEKFNNRKMPQYRDVSY